MERTPGTSSSLCVRAKNWQISVRVKWYANRLQMAQRRFAVPSTHTCIWFANHLRVVCEPFGVLVYTRLYKSEQNCNHSSQMDLRMLISNKNRCRTNIYLPINVHNDGLMKKLCNSKFGQNWDPWCVSGNCDSPLSEEAQISNNLV